MNEKKAYSVDISVSGSITVMAASEEEAQQLVDNGLAGEDSALLQEIISMLKEHNEKQDMQVTDIYEE